MNVRVKEGIVWKRSRRCPNVALKVSLKTLPVGLLGYAMRLENSDSEEFVLYELLQRCHESMKIVQWTKLHL